MRRIIFFILISALSIQFSYASDQNTTKFLKEINIKAHQHMPSMNKLANILKTKIMLKKNQNKTVFKINKNKYVLTIMYLYSMSVGKESLEQFMDQSANIMNKFKNIKFYAIMQNIPKIDFVKYLNSMYKPKYSNFDMKMQPYVFKDLNITKVPDFLFSECPLQFKWKMCKNLYIVRGDITLDKALSVVSDKNATFKKYERVIY